MALNNETILANVYLAGSNDFQQRIPDPTQNSIAAVTDALFSPYNRDLYNQFLGLMNMIAFTYVKGRRFENPMSEFKKERLNGGGKTIREIAPKWFKAHSFNPDNETLLKLEKPEFEQWFYTVNRQDQYEFSWITEELKFAMTEGGEYGLNSLLAATMDALISSDNYDEMISMLAMFGQANERWNKPIYTYHLDSSPVDTASANAFLQAVRSLVYSLEVQPTELYNFVDIPVFAKPEELILLTTPNVRAALDVNSFAAAFNLDYATAKARIITIPENSTGIPNTDAILTTYDWFECRDSYYGIESAPYNPANMSNKYYLQHWEIIDANPLVPVIRFSTDPETINVVVTETPEKFILDADRTTIKAGETVQLMPHLIGTLETSDNSAVPESIRVAPDACTFTVSGVNLNSRTYVDKYGKLHTQKSFKPGDVITVTAVSTYPADGLTAQVEITIE